MCLRGINNILMDACLASAINNISNSKDTRSNKLAALNAAAFHETSNIICAGTGRICQYELYVTWTKD